MVPKYWIFGEENGGGAVTWGVKLVNGGDVILIRRGTVILNHDVSRIPKQSAVKKESHLTWNSKP